MKMMGDKSLDDAKRIIDLCEKNRVSILTKEDGIEILGFENLTDVIRFLEGRGNVPESCTDLEQSDSIKGERILEFNGHALMKNRPFRAPHYNASLNALITSFLDKVRTCLVAGWTGGTFDTAENNLATGIDFFAMISVDAKVMCIVKTAFVIPVAEPVQPDFF